MRATTILGSDDLDSLASLGRSVRLARIRRDLSQSELADRIGVTRPSIMALEAGKPGLAIGILLKALTVFGYPDRFADLLGSDPLGDEIDATKRRRVRNRRHVADF